MDVKTTFLNGKIEHEVFVEQPNGFVLHNKDTHVCKLRKALYGLKQAPRVWYDRIDGFLKSLGFQKSDVDANLYFKVRGNQPVILILYVDDLFLAVDEGLIAQSTSEVEYIAASDASKEAVWLRELVFGFFDDKLETTVVHCDNQSCIKLIENLVFHDRSKHIDMKYHYIRDLVQRKTIKLQYIATSEQVVDILTKPLPLRQFVQLRGKLGVAKNESLAEREC
jgi:hypothetical protein